MLMFILTIFANSTYGMAIVLRHPTADVSKFFESTLPYIIGSLGTLAWDVVILGQALVYR